MSPATPGGATLADWIEGARLRTLPAAAAPVIVGVAAAYALGSFHPLRSFLALSVALLLQIGVNYSNDYSAGRMTSAAVPSDSPGRGLLGLELF